MMKTSSMHDYIIVGAGSAGCVMANRLSEDPKTTVLLLEAGGPDKKQEIHIPAAFAKLFKSSLDWTFYTEEQAHLNHRKLYWPRGKVLGGSSAINAQIYTRGHPHDYDHWRDAGNEGWGFSDLFPYFMKIENQERGTPEHHATGGPLNVADLRSPNPLSLAFVDACVAAGLSGNHDFNGAEQEGAGLFQVTQKKGKRHSVADAYLKPVLNRANLHVLTFAHTTHLLFEGNQAVGVEYVQNGKTEQVLANREVILCGGAVNSPQLLMLSGIGPAEHLNALDIPLVADLPGVGQNLQDHLLAGTTYACTQPLSLANAEKLANVLNFLFFRKGMLTSNVAEAGAFLKTKPTLSSPDLELIFGPVFYMSHGFLNPEGHGFSTGPILLHPQSRGYITLQSGDPMKPPLIQPNYLAHKNDLDLLIEGVKLARKVAYTKAFDAYRGKEVWPGENVKNDAEIAEFIRNTAETLYHPVGTCKMGTDKMAVVNNHLQVYRIKGLRVVDASVMPTLVSGHPNAAVIMIAEKAVDLIRETHLHN